MLVTPAHRTLRPAEAGALVLATAVPRREFDEGRPPLVASGLANHQSPGPEDFGHRGWHVGQLEAGVATDPTNTARLEYMHATG